MTLVRVIPEETILFEVFEDRVVVFLLEIDDDFFDDVFEVLRDRVEVVLSEEEDVSLAEVRWMNEDEDDDEEVDVSEVEVGRVDVSHVEEVSGMYTDEDVSGV